MQKCWVWWYKLVYPAASGRDRRITETHLPSGLAEFVALSQRRWVSRLNTGFYRDKLILFTHKEVLKRILVLQKTIKINLREQDLVHSLF